MQLMKRPLIDSFFPPLRDFGLALRHFAESHDWHFALFFTCPYLLYSLMTIITVIIVSPHFVHTCNETVSTVHDFFQIVPPHIHQHYTCATESYPTALFAKIGGIACHGSQNFRGSLHQASVPRLPSHDDEEHPYLYFQHVVVAA